MFTNLTANQVRALKALAKKVRDIRLDAAKPTLKTGFNLDSRYTCFSMPLMIDAWIEAEKPFVNLQLSQQEKDVLRIILLPITWFTFDRSLFAPDTEYQFTGIAFTADGRQSGRSLPLYILIGPDETITPPPEPEPEPPPPVKPGKGIGRDKKR